MTNKTTKQPTLQESFSELQQILSSTSKLTRRIIFGLIVVVALVAVLILGIMLLVEELFHITETSSAYLWVFVAVSLGVGIIVGTILSIWFSKMVKKAIKPYFDALDKVSQGDFTTGVADDNEILKNTLVAEKFNHMVKSLRSVETLREGFISDFSHEFKTPIVSIAGFAKLLKTADLTEEERNEYLDVIINESDRLVNLSQSVLALSRLDYQVVEKTTYSLDEQLRQSVLLFDKALKDKNIQLDLSTEVISVHSSQQLLSQVWVNILANAIKFSPRDSKIDVVATEVGDKVSVSIQDYGCGMDEETQRYIFNKFYQGDKSHSREGNGLGLAIVHKILRLVGGDIQVQSELGKGSTFTVLLPKTK